METAAAAPPLTPMDRLRRLLDSPQDTAGEVARELFFELDNGLFVAVANELAGRMASMLIARSPPATPALLDLLDPVLDWAHVLPKHDAQAMLEFDNGVMLRFAVFHGAAAVVEKLCTAHPRVLACMNGSCLAYLIDGALTGLWGPAMRDTLQWCVTFVEKHVAQGAPWAVELHKSFWPSLQQLPEERAVHVELRSEHRCAGWDLVDMVRGVPSDEAWDRHLHTGFVDVPLPLLNHAIAISFHGGDDTQGVWYAMLDTRMSSVGNFGSIHGCLTQLALQGPDFHQSCTFLQTHDSVLSESQRAVLLRTSLAAAGLQSTESLREHLPLLSRVFRFANFGVLALRAGHDADTAQRILDNLVRYRVLTTEDAMVALVYVMSAGLPSPLFSSLLKGGLPRDWFAKAPLATQQMFLEHLAQYLPSDHDENVVPLLFEAFLPSKMASPRSIRGLCALVLTSQRPPVALRILCAGIAALRRKGGLVPPPSAVPALPGLGPFTSVFDSDEEVIAKQMGAMGDADLAFAAAGDAESLPTEWTLDVSIIQLALLALANLRVEDLESQEPGNLLAAIGEAIVPGLWTLLLTEDADCVKKVWVALRAARVRVAFMHNDVAQEALDHWQHNPMVWRQVVELVTGTSVAVTSDLALFESIIETTSGMYALHAHAAEKDFQHWFVDFVATIFASYARSCDLYDRPVLPSVQQFVATITSAPCKAHPSHLISKLLQVLLAWTHDADPVFAWALEAFAQCVHNGMYGADELFLDMAAACAAGLTVGWETITHACLQTMRSSSSWTVKVKALRMIQGLSMVEGIQWTNPASILDGMPWLDEALEALQGDDALLTADIGKAREALGRIMEKALAGSALIASQHMQRVEEEAAAFIAARAERERGTFP